MRLLIQGCLILGLCLFSTFATAQWEEQADGSLWLWATSAQMWGAERAEWRQGKIDGFLSAHGNKPNYYRIWEREEGCTGNVVCMRFYGYTWESADPIEPVDCSPETGNVCSGEIPQPCQSPDFIDPDSGECRSPQQPEECYENGQIYDADYGRCVLECPNGQLNGVCLQDTADNTDECNADSPDYKGFIGNGATKHNLCTSNMECESGAFGLVNGTPACIPDEYGPPTCEIESVLVIDEYGYVCGNPQDAPEPGQEPDEWWKDEEPNTDTDGDGEPDEYQRENDPTSVDKGLGKISDGLGDTNNKIDGTNQRLDKVGKGIDAVNKNLNEGLGTANQTLGQINEKLDGPDNGYSTDGLGDAPTFQESTERLRTSIATNPTIQAVTTIPTIASNNTCPVWTIPSTDYWSAMTIDSHCQILNDHRGLLSMLFIAVWTIAAVFVFLRA